MAAGGEALDVLWEVLAQAAAAAGGAERERLFLAKLALLLARELDDPARLAALVETALRDLE